jgi:hypothetical protein
MRDMYLKFAQKQMLIQAKIDEVDDESKEKENEMEMVRSAL